VRRRSTRQVFPRAKSGKISGLVMVMSLMLFLATSRAPARKERRWFSFLVKNILKRMSVLGGYFSFAMTEVV